MAWRRIARWACAVVALATVALWVYSSFRLWSATYGPWGIGNETTWPGTLILSYATTATPGPFFYSSKNVPRGEVNLLPWSYGWFRKWPTAPGVYRVTVPFWIPLAVSLLGFVLRRPKRRPPHGCRKCEYDLTGNVSGICSECGTPIEAVEKPV